MGAPKARIAFTELHDRWVPAAWRWGAARACAAGLLVAVVLTACSSGTESDTATPLDREFDAQLQSAEALIDYVEAEKATIAQIMADFPGLYADIRVTGSLEESRGDRGLPVGIFSVVFYDYTYAQDMDWSLTMQALDGQRLAIDEVCRTTIFPAMRAAGVTGPLSAVYSYGDGRSQFGAMWHHTCSDY